MFDSDWMSNPAYFMTRCNKIWTPRQPCGFRAIKIKTVNIHENGITIVQFEKIQKFNTSLLRFYFRAGHNFEEIRKTITREKSKIGTFQD